MRIFNICEVVLRKPDYTRQEFVETIFSSIHKYLKSLFFFPSNIYKIFVIATLYLLSYLYLMAIPDEEWHLFPNWVSEHGIAIIGTMLNIIGFVALNSVLRIQRIKKEL